MWFTQVHTVGLWQDNGKISVSAWQSWCAEWRKQIKYVLVLSYLFDNREKVERVTWPQVNGEVWGLGSRHSAVATEATPITCPQPEPLPRYLVWHAHLPLISSPVLYRRQRRPRCHHRTRRKVEWGLEAATRCSLCYSQKDEWDSVSIVLVDMMTDLTTLSSTLDNKIVSEKQLVFGFLLPNWQINGIPTHKYSFYCFWNHLWI